MKDLDRDREPKLAALGSGTNEFDSTPAERTALVALLRRERVPVVVPEEE